MVLFDYLGIGIPTPPTSRGVSPTPLDEEYLGTGKGVNDECVITGSTHVPRVDRSLLEDALDFASLGSVPASSLYASAWQSLSAQRETVTESNEQRCSSSASSEEETWLPRLEGGAQTKNSVWGVDGKLTMGIDLNVKSLTVTFNKLEHPLARGNVSSVSAQVKMRRGNVEIGGKLGEASVTDLTETGAYYRDRYIACV